MWGLCDSRNREESLMSTIVTTTRFLFNNLNLLLILVGGTSFELVTPAV